MLTKINPAKKAGFFVIDMKNQNFNQLRSKAVRKIEKSAIAEILRVINQPGMISLAGGLPAKETFPTKIIEKLASFVIKKYGSLAFQYGPTEGLKPLREALVSFLKEKGIETTFENIGIVSGSQQFLDLIARVFINPADYIAVEAPTYIGAVDAFSPYQPKFLEIKTDEEGIIPSDLEKKLKQKKVKFLYLVSTFQNPTGRTMSEKRRKEVAKVIKKFNLLTIEDDPYGSLRYFGKSPLPLQVFAPKQTVYLSTFSKILSPGLRIGFYVAPKEVFLLINIAKQTVDLHTNSFSQLIAAEYLLTGDFKNHLPKIIEIYKKRQKAMLDALEKYFPKDFSWTKPEGGMFIWVEGPKNFDSVKTYWQAVEKKVAYVPGCYFFVKKGQGKNTFRLNFTNVSEEKISEAIKRLSEVIKKNI